MSDTTITKALIVGLMVGVIIGGIIGAASSYGSPQTAVHTEPVACLPPRLIGSYLKQVPLGAVYDADNGSYIAFSSGGGTPIKLSNAHVTLPLNYDQPYSIRIAFNLYKTTGTVCDELNPVNQISSAYLVNSTGGIVR